MSDGYWGTRPKSNDDLTIGFARFGSYQLSYAVPCLLLTTLFWIGCCVVCWQFMIRMLRDLSQPLSSVNIMDPKTIALSFVIVAGITINSTVSLSSLILYIGDYDTPVTEFLFAYTVTDSWPRLILSMGWLFFCVFMFRESFKPGQQDHPSKRKSDSNVHTYHYSLDSSMHGYSLNWCSTDLFLFYLYLISMLALEFLWSYAFSRGWRVVIIVLSFVFFSTDVISPMLLAGMFFERLSQLMTTLQLSIPMINNNFRPSVKSRELRMIDRLVRITVLVIIPGLSYLPTLVLIPLRWKFIHSTLFLWLVTTTVAGHAFTCVVCSALLFDFADREYQFLMDAMHRLVLRQALVYFTKKQSVMLTERDIQDLVRKAMKLGHSSMSESHRRGTDDSGLMTNSQSTRVVWSKASLSNSQRTKTTIASLSERLTYAGSSNASHSDDSDWDDDGHGVQIFAAQPRAVVNGVTVARKSSFGIESNQKYSDAQ